MIEIVVRSVRIADAVQPVGAAPDVVAGPGPAPSGWRRRLVRPERSERG